MLMFIKAIATFSMLEISIWTKTLFTMFWAFPWIYRSSRTVHSCVSVDYSSEGFCGSLCHGSQAAHTALGVVNIWWRVWVYTAAAAALPCLLGSSDFHMSYCERSLWVSCARRHAQKIQLLTCGFQYCKVLSNVSFFSPLWCVHS